MNVSINGKIYNFKSVMEQNSLEENEKIFAELWNEENESNQYVLSYYGRVLRKLGKQIDFIDICRNFIRSGKKITNKYVLLPNYVYFSFHFE